MQHTNSSFKTAWSIQETVLFLNSEHMLEWQGSLGDFLKNKKPDGCHFHPLPPTLDAQTPAGTSI